MKDNIDKLIYWITERHSVYVGKSSGYKKPWTTDEILQNYKFCNVYRELDKETVWIRENWGTPHNDNPDLWFVMTVARLVNWSPTLAQIPFPVPWNEGKFIRAMRGASSGKLFGSAYIISTNGNEKPKVEYVAQNVLSPLWKARELIRPVAGDTLEHFHGRLTCYNGIGSFMGAQIVADTKFHGALKSASDWWTWAASGPGSKRGLNRALGFDKNRPQTETAWRAAFTDLYFHVRPIIEKDMPSLSAQDFQNCLCEFDKYMRALTGEGRPKSRYPGSK